MLITYRVLRKANDSKLPIHYSHYSKLPILEIKSVPIPYKLTSKHRNSPRNEIMLQL